uniref:COP9 signalosome complex subunit 3 N-terminal helical repeats domain-containing protein n=1 Tax=Brassica oleracea var. oleracea TaxID=109376 RepID=A0A0D3B137_BRAOL
MMMMTKLWSSENPLRGVAPLLAAVHKVQVSTKRLTALHPDCLQLCLLAKCSKAGFSVLSDDDILERFQKALELLYNVVTAPMHVVNAIALEAYKKYILVTLIHSGQFSISPPKCASTTAKNSFKTWSTPYIDVGMRYNDGKISELEAVVVANSSDFEKDKNLGLVKQAVSSLYKRNSEVLDLVASRYSQHGPTC